MFTVVKLNYVGYRYEVGIVVWVVMFWFYGVGCCGWLGLDVVVIVLV